LPKNNENVPLPILTPDGPGADPGPKPFAHHQMVVCEECLRTNPPTRINCLYCGGPLPISETTANLQKPALRPLEKWERGYNNILLPDSANQPFELSEAELTEAASLLKLDAADLVEIVSLQMPLPLARSATLEEASLVQRRLRAYRIDTRIVADSQLGAEDAGSIRVRGAEINDSGMRVYQQPGAAAMEISWSELVLLVVGRLITKRIELRERRASGENRIEDSSEFFSDETAVDFFTMSQSMPYRIRAKSFDFSCLKAQKGLLAEENISTLLAVFRTHAPQAEWDESYNLTRKALEIVWPLVQQNESGGWRRDRPGKISRGSITEISNEEHFLKYSRLRYYFHPAVQTNEYS
jgi:hypothetical protein